MINLFNAGLNHLTFEVVGFSIGAQFGGYVGRKIRKRSKIILPRIVGLEPGIASPENLSSSDATFVMTIHTGEVFGERNVIGHVGFYPNGGKNQPMCKKKLLFIDFDDAICNHGQAQFFWIEAVKTKSVTDFPARKCDTYNDFVEKRCNKNSIGYMNTKTSATLKGKYYLSTNFVSPFSKAEP